MLTARRALPTALLAGALAAPALAGAALPTFKTTKTIVVGKSIGGVTLGASPAKGKKAWGAKGARCFDTDGSGYCLWRKSKNDINGGEGTFSYTNGKIDKIELKSPTKSTGGRAFVKPFTIPQSSKKIGIGSKFSAVEKAYPKGKHTDSRKNTYAVQSGLKLTLFESFGTKKLAGVSVEILPSS